MVTDAGIAGLSLITVPDRVCATLIDAANESGGHDNVTVVVAAL